MLNSEHHDIACDVLVRFITHTADPRTALANGLDYLLAIQITNGSPIQMVQTALRLCMDDGYRSNPPALSRLLGLVQVFDARIPQIIAGLRPPLPGVLGESPFGDKILYTYSPFLERSIIRSALRRLLESRPAQPFVVVNGLSNQGKSYTTDFISHVLRDRTDIFYCLVKIPPKGGAAVGPLELARDLVVRLCGERKGEPTENPSNLERWHEELISWVIEAGVKSGLNWWIVLDGFNAKELRSETRQLIGALALRLTNGMPAMRFRLILLDFDHTVLPVRPGLIHLETVGPIPKMAVADFLQTLLAGAPQIDVGQAYQAVTDDFPDPISDLAQLAARLEDLMSEIEVR